MKLKSLWLAFFGVCIIAAGCIHKGAANENNHKGTESKNAKKVLIAYFSATGTTQKVAKDLAEVMDGTIYEITPETPYSEADLDWTDKNSRSTVEMNDSTSRPSVKGVVENIKDYDIIFIGYPIWWYVAPTIINTFIDKNDLSGKEIICFATSGESPIEPSIKALKKQYPALNWEGGKLLNHYNIEDLEAWKTELGLSK